MRLDDLTGKTFGSLIVIKKIPWDKQGQVRTTWLCKCECGEYRKVTTPLLKISKNITCGALKCRLRIKDSKKATINNKIDAYKQNAKRHGREYSLTDEDCQKLLLGRCYYCNLEPYNEINVYKRKNGTYKNGKVKTEWTEEATVKLNGIDRIDNNLGYTKDNCVSCCYMCNSFKSDFAINDFLNHVKKIFIHLNLNEQKHG